MTATLSVINNFSLESQGTTKSGKQGTSTNAATLPFDITVTGNVHHVTGSLATAAVATVYDDDDDLPANFDYLFYWCDQNSYIQIMCGTTPTTSAIFPVTAKVPFTLAPFTSGVAGFGSNAASAITGGTEPTNVLTDIDSIIIGNYSGTAANYVFAVVD